MVQIMMAAGMMGLLSLGMMKLMENQTLSEKSLRSRAAVQNFYSEAKAYLARPGYCAKNFEGVYLKDGVEFELEDILKSNGKPIYKKGEIYELGLIRLDSITTRNFEKDSEFKGLMQLVFNFSKVGKSYGAKKYVRVVKLSLELDKEGRVLNCSTLGSPSSFSFEGSENTVNTEGALNDLYHGKETEDSKKVKSLIEGSSALKEMNKNLEKLKESNKQLEEMFKD
ncbi:MAG: hypothetical protein CES88_13040 [Halobacteriovorax sp. JY17]|nr:MAG: hypothetical protein CES88_13040 [Halobacteriovorax sp. JY17]